MFYKILKNTIFYGLIVLQIFLIIISVTNKLGVMSLEVLSGSMLPNLAVGDIVFVAKGTYNIGDIVTYEEDGYYTTHRIVQMDDMTYVTKGDANNTLDKAITSSQIAGKLSFVMTHSSYVIIRVSLILLTIVLFYRNNEGKGIVVENKNN